MAGIRPHDLPRVVEFEGLGNRLIPVIPVTDGDCCKANQHFVEGEMQVGLRRKTCTPIAAKCRESNHSAMAYTLRSQG